MAGPLAEAEAAQAVTRRQTELAELEAVRREKELLASTIKTAQAEAQAAVARAQGARSATIAAAQGEAARVRFEGQAAADAIYARGEAEAEALSLRAEAYRQFNEAAIVSAILERLPDIVRAAAEPISGIESLTVLSTDGASEVVRTATSTVAQAGAVVQSLTGIDLRSAVDSAMTNVGEAIEGWRVGDGEPAPRPTHGHGPRRRPPRPTRPAAEEASGSRGGGGRGPGGDRRPRPNRRPAG